MVKGFPDWGKKVIQAPVVTCYHWGYGGCEPLSDTDTCDLAWIEVWAEDNLGGKDVYVYSFQSNGWIMFLRAVDHIHSYMGVPCARVLFLDPDGKYVAGLAAIDTPIMVRNVNRIVIQIILPLSRLADTTYPAYYTYAVSFSLAYTII